MASLDIIIRTIEQGAGGAVNFARRVGSAWKDLATPLNQTVQLFDRVAQAGQQAWQMIGEGAEMSRARQQLENLAVSIGSTYDAITAGITEATQGMMSQADIIASAGQIISLGLADSEQGVVDLATTVSELGWDMQQVILTFANNSKMRLDALGLSVEDVDRRTQKFIDQGYEMDKAFDLAVLEAGKAKIELLGSAAETAAGKIKMVETVFKDIRDSFQLGFAESFAEGLDISGLESGLGNAAADAQQLGESLGEISANLMPALISQASALAEAMGVFARGVGFSMLMENALEQGWITEEQAREATIAYRDLGQEAGRAMLDGFIEGSSQRRFDMAAAEGAEQFGESWADAAAVASGERWAEVAPEVAEVWVSKLEEAVSGAAARRGDVGRKGGIASLLLGGDQLAEALFSNEAVATLEARAGEIGNRAAQAFGTGFREIDTSAYFGEAMDLVLDPESAWNFGEALFHAAEGAGASADALALLGVATGQFTEAQAEAILKQAALIEKAEQLGAAIAQGMDFSAALGEFEQFMSDLENRSYRVDIEAGIVFEGHEDVNTTISSIFGDWFPGRMGGLEEGAGTFGGASAAADIVVTIGAEGSQAIDTLNFIRTEQIDPFLAGSPYEAEILAQAEQAISTMDMVIDKARQIPREINIAITATANNIAATVDDAVAEASQAVGI